MKLLRAVILVGLCVVLVNSAILGGHLEEDLKIYEGRIRIIYRMIAEECPGYSTSKRQIPMEHQSLNLRVQKQLYAKLLKELFDCKKLAMTASKTLTTEQPATTTKVKPTTTPTTEQPATITKVKPTATPTTEQPTTTKVKPTTTLTTEQPATTTKEKPTTIPTTEQPTTTTKEKSTTTPATPYSMKCQQAINYTQSWRSDHNGSDIRPGGPNSILGYACDIHFSNTEWFRFTGEAGNKMLDRCPKFLSCGTSIPNWTDADMPRVVGVESTVDVYGVIGIDCKFLTKQVRVMRCSNDTEHDFIYQQTSNFVGTCNHAFCGMI